MASNLAVYAEPNVRQAIVSNVLEARRTEETFSDRLVRFHELMVQGELLTLEPALPLLLNIRGQPFRLEQHPQFEEFFNLEMPPKITYKTARQVGKSTVQSSKGVILAATQPYFTILYITPLFEQIRRFSSNYVGPFINDSPVRSMMVGTSTVNSVLHRSFKNQSKMILSYAFLSPDRIRGISCQCVVIDEIQDFDSSHMPVVRETMSFFPDWGIENCTGTPKTLDNTLEDLWGNSSQAEWFIPCPHCTTNGYPTWNIPSTEFHLLKMLGPYHPGISEKYPGTVCYKCALPISPRTGRWRHRYPDRQWEHAGYHIPQCIMPFHYAYPHKWRELLMKQQGMNNTTVANFYNEVLGESYDESSKLVSQTELQAVSMLGPCTPSAALARRNDYKMCVLAADWGGGGEKGVSFTALALVCLRRDGIIEVPWGIRLLTPHDHLKEANDVLAFWRYFAPDVLAHDYTGAGSLRETFVVQAGIPINKIMPCEYVRSASAAPCYHVPATEVHPRDHYRVDKTRTLLLLCALIRQQKLRMFDYDHVNKEQSGLIHDFLSLVEDKINAGTAGEIYRITRARGGSDDFAQAVNIGCTAIWYKTGWPDLLKNINPITRAQMEQIEPSDPHW